MTTLLEGAGIAHDDPLKEYAAIKFLYQKGEFKTEHQQKIVEEYMNGLENHLNVTDEGVDKVKSYMADMERDWAKLQQQEKQTPYIQNVVNVTKAQLHEPNAIREATGPATTAAV
jgi:septal ring factor EnvC (AmiA/AmiB activator)